MRVGESGPGRLIIHMENLSRIGVLLLTLFNPGDLQSVYFLDRLSPPGLGILQPVTGWHFRQRAERKPHGLICEQVRGSIVMPSGCRRIEIRRLPLSNPDKGFSRD